MKIRILTLSLLALLCALSSFADEDPPTHNPVIVEFDSPAQASELLPQWESDGAIVYGRRDELALVSIPLDMLPSARRAKGVRSLQRSKRNAPLMDKAMEWCDAGLLFSDRTQGAPYSGKGIVVGLADIGFDPSHPAFRSADGSDLRIKKMTIYDDYHGRRLLAESPEDILALGTDDADEFHATHVANIMAGSTFRNPYPGMARDAEIVVSCSRLTDMGLLAGCEDIIAYAKSVGKPCVINMSMGYYAGPHDGTSLFSRYVEKMSEDAIFCLSTGNNGKSPWSLSHTFSPSLPEIRFTVKGNDWVYFDVEGIAEVWNADARPLERMHLYFYNNTNKYIDITPDGISLADLKEWSISSTPGSPDYSEVFAAHCEGSVEMRFGVSPANDRYSVKMYYNYHMLENDVSGEGEVKPWAKYFLSFGFTASPEVQTTVTVDGISSWLGYWGGFPATSTALSVSDLCTGESVTSVGMYCSRESYPLITGEEKIWNDSYRYGEVTPHSSYGVLLDGRVTPLTTAPGAPVVSAASSYCINAVPERRGWLSHVETVDGAEAYWVAEGGTSMSSPFVAGTIACWLQADPTLTSERVKEIITASNTTYDPASSNTISDDPRWGLGRFEPYRGLLEVLKQSGVTPGSIADDPSDASSRISFSVSSDAVTIYNPDALPLEITLHDLTGRLLLTASTGDPIHSLTLPRGNSSPLLLTVRPPFSAPVTRKILP